MIRPRVKVFRDTHGEVGVTAEDACNRFLQNLVPNQLIDIRESTVECRHGGLTTTLTVIYKIDIPEGAE